METYKVVLDSFQNQSKHSTALSRIGAIFIARTKMAMNYRAAYFMTILLNLVTIFLYFFFGKLNPNVTIGGIPVQYFEFAFIGLSLQMVVGTSMATVNRSIFSEIQSGTWSSLLMHFNIFEYALGTSLAGIILASVSIFIAYGISILILGMNLVIPLIALLLIFVLFLLLMLSHIAISLFFSAFAIWYKKDTGIITMLYQLTKTFSGIVFPVAVLSGYPFAFIISRILPLTYGLEAMHNVLFNPSGGINVVLLNSAVLAGFIFIFGVIGWVLVKRSIRLTKVKGTVEFY